MLALTMFSTLPSFFMSRWMNVLSVARTPGSSPEHRQKVPLLYHCGLVCVQKSVFRHASLLLRHQAKTHSRQGFKGSAQVPEEAPRNSGYAESNRVTVVLMCFAKTGTASTRFIEHLKHCAAVTYSAGPRQARTQASAALNSKALATTEDLQCELRALSPLREVTGRVIGDVLHKGLKEPHVALHFFKIAWQWTI